MKTTDNSNNTIIIMLGQNIVGNFGTAYPNKNGIIVDFKTINSRFSGDYIAAVILWEGEQLETVALSEIHNKGWRSANGSPHGIFIK